eukprot:TRINITY_DN145_c4_g1_i1.p1 TRINITY_DN145_c4_g1~~TRINITY_DN145_c4_g1_i1.p1  ORF type:complete len:1103 (-),score=403.39 TRINITY_DN145_c4_g1_i1:604-3912(-)
MGCASSTGKGGPTVVPTEEVKKSPGAAAPAAGAQHQQAGVAAKDGAQASSGTAPASEDLGGVVAEAHEANVYTNAPWLTEGDVHQRLVHSAAAASMTITTSGGGAYDVRYAFVSQRGYYPDAPDKANQDAFVVMPKFGGDPNSLFVGVFDGHGGTGDECSNFAAEYLPRTIMQAAGASWKDLSEEAALSAMSAAHVRVNRDMHAAPFDDTLSGTTAISVMLKGELLMVNNVGDSRAILCLEENGALVVKPLSIDQTPFRRDERDRVKAAGAKVMTIDQIDGIEPLHENWDTVLGEEVDEVGDPPRIWCETLDRPGCAFTRSIGDSVGESVGVIAEPEQLVREIGPDDRFLVVASDGVFEFLTSRAVQDIIAKFDDPLEAAKYVVQESFRLWLQYEVRTDDISAIIVFFDEYREAPPPKLGASQDSMNSNMSTYSATLVARKQRLSVSGGTEAAGMRPVRRYFSKEARNRLIREGAPRAAAGKADEGFDFHKARVPKSTEEAARIARVISKVFLFSQLSPAQMDKVVQVMKPEFVKAGDPVIKQGDEGDKFYVVDSGTYGVSVTDHKGQANQVSVITEPGASFGELSLMYGKPRTATVTCTRDGQLWSLDRRAFRGVLVERMVHEDMIKVLRKVKTLSKLTTLRLQQLCEALKEEEFKAGEYIARQGEAGDKFYVVASGEVSCCLRGEGGEEEQVSRIGKNGFFGETALLRSDVRKVSFVAAGQVRVLSLSRADVEARLGRLIDVLEADMAREAKTMGVHAQDAAAARALAGSQYSDLTFLRWAVQLGNYGFVATMEHRRLGRAFSVKVISKCAAADEGQEAALAHEAAILRALSKSCAFVPAILHTMQDARCFCTVYKARVACDLIALADRRPLTQPACQWLCACIASGVAHLHEEGIIHRRVTPHCVYITEQGYAQIADMSCATKMTGSRAYTMIGDPQYLAPEVISGQGYGFSVDHWALGILTYEMLEAATPFGKGSISAGNASTAELSNETEIYINISCFDPAKLGLSSHATPAAAAFMRSLLAPAPENRLGYSGADAVRAHDFFQGIAWDAMDSGEARPPAEITRLLAALDDRSDPEYEREFLSQAASFDSGSMYSSL